MSRAVEVLHRLTMSRSEHRQHVQEAREHLENWVFEARDRAYEEFFEGEDAVLDDDDLAHLDWIDSKLSRQEGQGLWGADEYAVLPPSDPDLEEADVQVVCTYHPEVPEYAVRGESAIDDETRDRFNRVLWDYSERVAQHVEEQMEAYLAGPEE